MGKRGPDSKFEKAAIARGASVVCGVDEAGCGPWAGPVVAAAVILDRSKRTPRGINDSKLLSAETRERLFVELQGRAVIGIGIAEVERIDRDNILVARLWAMEQAVLSLAALPCIALVDGDRAPALACNVETIVEGDRRSLSIAAASIVAKVTRDRIMVALHQHYPDYGFAQHKGYGTAEHQEALARLGPSPHHRKSWAPIRALLQAVA
ncbi:MAG: ribonuclease HII [Rhizobiales bacterium]|nr:ribonuclease HII [Hyphomicrobiales bacterium]